MGEMGAAGAAAAATCQQGWARAWLRRNFGSICAVGGGEASGRRAEAKLGHEAGRRIRARRRKPPALPAHARSPAGVERVAASRGGLARRERQRRGRSAVRRPRRTPLVEEYLYVFGFLMPEKHGGAGKRQRADGGCAAPGRRRPAQLVKPSAIREAAPFLCALFDWLCDVWFLDLAIAAAVARERRRSGGERPGLADVPIVATGLEGTCVDKPAGARGAGSTQTRTLLLEGSPFSVSSNPCFHS